MVTASSRNIWAAGCSSWSWVVEVRLGCRGHGRARGSGRIVQRIVHGLVHDVPFLDDCVRLHPLQRVPFGQHGAVRESRRNATSHSLDGRRLWPGSLVTEILRAYPLRFLE